MSHEEIAIFAPVAARDFGEQVCARLGLSLSAHEEREFEDGEHKMRPLVSVRGRDVFVIQSLYADSRQSVNDKLCRLLFFLGALRDASAERVTAVIPYLCYARKDRRSKPRDPVTTRYIAALFEAVGVDRVVTMDVHNLAAFQNAFRIHTDHLEAKKLFVEYLAPLLGQDEVVVVSPDTGGVKRAEDFRQSLSHALGRQVYSAFLEKYRSAGVVSGEAVVGEVAGRTAIIIDDLISSGTTLARAAESCRARGAGKVYAAATHGVFVGAAGQALSHPALEKVIVTNTIPPFRLPPELVRARLAVLDAAKFFADAIRRIHNDESIVELLEF
ncbi:MAG: ribose-phosphate pyrophosphokinase [Acidobacteria bacterium]|nr:ribose-phosphate pyrophosphokinase [Acidobacteriota bacterium]